MTGGGCDWIQGCDAGPSEVGWFLTRYRKGDGRDGRLRRLCRAHARWREERAGDSVVELTEEEAAVQEVMRR